MGWRPANSLTVFHSQLKTAVPAAAPPATSVFAWGTIGDLAHTSTSDHAPKDFAGWGSDIVTAADQPHAPTLGLSQHVVGESLRLSRDPRIKYWIFNRRMFSSYASGSYSAWTWRPYSGDDPHDDHSHLSVVGDARADGTQPWAIGYGASMSGEIGYSPATATAVTIGATDEGWVAQDTTPAWDSAVQRYCNRMMVLGQNVDPPANEGPERYNLKALDKQGQDILDKLEQLQVGGLEAAVLEAAVERAVRKVVQELLPNLRIVDESA